MSKKYFLNLLGLCKKTNPEIILNHMSSKEKVQLSPEEQILRDREHVERICSDEDYAAYFFKEKCRPLLSKILWTMFHDDTTYDDLVHDLYIHLRKPNAEGEYWHNLRTFDYRTSLFDWIKTVAVNLFYTPSDEVFSMPKPLIEDGTVERVILDMKESQCRIFMWHRYINGKKLEEIADILNLEKKDMRALSRRSIKDFKKTLSEKYQEYYSLFFTKVKEEPIDNSKAKNLQGGSNSEKRLEAKFDVQKYLSSMPNERYRRVLTALFLECRTPQELAEEFGIEVSNVYNLKTRSIEQIRDVMILSGGLDKIEKYIPQIKDDRIQEIARSMFIKKQSYDCIISEFCLTKPQFKKAKSLALKELRALIFN